MSAVILDADRVNFVKKNKYDFTHVLLILPKNIVHNILTSQYKTLYINSPEVITKILYLSTVYNDIKKKLVIINKYSTDYLKLILDALYSKFDSNSFLWCCVALKSKNFTVRVEELAKNGFIEPYIVERTPLGQNINHSIALFKKNTPSKVISSSHVIYDILSTLEQYKQDYCLIYAKFTTKALEFLKKTAEIGITLNKNGQRTQKELTGILYPSNITKEGNRYIYHISVNENSIEHGSEEEVNVSPTRYNFHSHPKEAYIRHSVKNAWPSVTDYLGYLKLGNNTIFHCIATLEGVYILSFGKYWCKHVSKIKRKFIEEHYNISHKEPYTPEEYTQKINSILYYDYPIFDVQFLPWISATTPFKAYFDKDGLNCFTIDHVFK
jgi:hypothetical protein